MQEDSHIISSSNYITVIACSDTLLFYRKETFSQYANQTHIELHIGDAMRYGYCPNDHQDVFTGHVHLKGLNALLDDLNKDPFITFKEYELRLRGLEPNQLRDWFKTVCGITYFDYHRMLRINTALRAIQLQLNETLPKSAQCDEYISLFITTKEEATSKNLIYLQLLDTPIGPMYAGATENGLCMLEYSDRKMLETEFKDLCKRLDAQIIYHSNSIIEHTKTELKAYFEGKCMKFTIPIDAPGTPFQQKVWALLQTIPYGKTRSYQEQANLIENPKAVRAVATANGENRISIVIPCHRVIGKDGSLTGYGGGLHRKRWLLDFEQQHAGQQRLF